MGTHYKVFLDKAPTVNDFKGGTFPRNFHYRRDADALIQEVKSKGGEARLEPVTSRRRTTRAAQTE